MRIKLCFLLIILSCLFQTSFYAKDKHHLLIDKNKLSINNQFWISKGDNKDDIIKYLGQPNYIEDVFDGYIYYYHDYNLCFDIDLDNNITCFFYYFRNYPFESINYNVDKFTINEIEFVKDSNLSTVREMLDKYNIRYTLKDCRTYMVLVIFYELNEEIKEYYCRFTKNQILERIQY